MEAPRRLVLHFNINKTIVMKSSARREGIEFTLCRILAKHAWGRAIEKDDSYIWRLGHDSL